LFYFDFVKINIFSLSSEMQQSSERFFRVHKGEQKKKKQVFRIFQEKKETFFLFFLQVCPVKLRIWRRYPMIPMTSLCG
jgi:hypothetical protein